MLAFYNNLSPTTRLVLQSFFSVLGSVLAGVATAAYQSYTSAGHLDLQGLLNVSLLTFALLFGKTMHDWVPAHAQQLIAAYKDNETALRDALQRQQNLASAVVAASQSKQVASSTASHAAAPFIIQNSSPITPEHVQAISTQIALNLANMAAPAPPVTPASNPQAIPAVNIAAMNTAPVPVPATSATALTRNFNDSALMQAVQGQ